MNIEIKKMVHYKEKLINKTSVIQKQEFQDINSYLLNSTPQES